jgi:aryl-alcohol dehydrogenase-like predicted oxidoreductase
MRVGLGCVTFGREIDEAASFAIMDHAAERGITLFDTAEAYGGGASETVVGRWMASRGARDRITLCTKVLTNHTRGHVGQALDASLARLCTDRVDIYLFHSFDRGTPLDESGAAMADAVSSGKALRAGCSNYSAEQLAAASRHVRFDATQFNYNLCVRDAERGLFDQCRDLCIHAITYSPLGAGFLTGKYTPDRAAFPKGSRFDVVPGHADIYFSDRNFALAARLRGLSRRLGIPVERLALAWVLANPLVGTMLVGARTTAHLDNALEATSLGFEPEWRRELEGG